MSDATEPKIETTSEETPPAAPAGEKAPKWEGEFDPDRAARLVENLRKEAAQAKERAATLEKAQQEREDAEKTEAQRNADRAERAEADAKSARRELLAAKSVAKHGLPESAVGFLTGDTAEEIEAQAAALAELASASTKRPAEEIPGKPKPRLVPGQGEALGDDFDPTAVAERIRANL